MRRKVNFEAGFTLLELMVALTVGAILMSVVIGLFFSTIQDAEILQSRAALNQEARGIFDLAAMGGTRTGVNAGSPSGSTDHNYVFGLRGRSSGIAATAAAPAILDEDEFPDDFGAGVVPVSVSSQTNDFWAGQDSAGTWSLMARDQTDTADIYQFSLMPTKWTPVGPPDWALNSRQIASLDVTCTAVGVPLIECPGQGTVITVHGYLKAVPSVSVDGADARLLIQLIDPTMVARRSVNLDDVSGVYWGAFSQMVQQ